MNTILRRALGLLLLASLAFFTLLVIKPGASIFYLKERIKNEQAVPDAGYSYRYPLEINARLSPLEGMLLFEDGWQMSRTVSTTVIESGEGTFTLDRPDGGKTYLYFAPSDNSDPRTNSRTYRLYYRTLLLSRSMGLIYVFILGGGLVWFLRYAIGDPTRRQAVLESPRNIFHLWDDFLSREIVRVFAPFTGAQGQAFFRAVVWRKLAALTVLAAYLYAALEWVFFVTKPSFMDLMHFSEKLEILFLSALTAALPGLILLLICGVLGVLLSFAGLGGISVMLGALVPTFMLAADGLLMIDNFSYVVLRFGIVDSQGLQQGVYALVFMILLAYFYKQVLAYLNSEGATQDKRDSAGYSFYAAGGLLLISLIWAGVRFAVSGDVSAGEMQAASGASNRPDIILLGSDGLEADHLSIYGYERETTPYISELAGVSLLAENAFTNAGTSAGSVTSILTGKLPTTTRVLYYPDILRGVDAFQHLPGILRREGYRSIELGVPNYVDSYNINLQGGFDSVNGRSLDAFPSIQILRQFGYGDAVYFGLRLVEWLSDRLQHIFYIKAMDNPYAMVTQMGHGMSDSERLEELVHNLDEAKEPLFAHVHMMGTHGPHFDPQMQVFSAGQEQVNQWMMDFYDDAILTFDGYVAELLEYLRESGSLENTLLILYSDHGMNYDLNSRLPLILRFPGGEHQGSISANTQNLDIAPTILDYLGLPAPEWMEGRSLLENRAEGADLIFGAGTAGDLLIVQEGITLLDSNRLTPPFYQIVELNVINCQRWYQIDLTSMVWVSGEIAGHTKPCPEDELLPFNYIQSALEGHLVSRGFDVSSLP